jgi:hypothetical protein
MSPDTNNDLGNEDEEDDEENIDDDDDDDEPVFKFSSVTALSMDRSKPENSADLSINFSCIAVHEKFLVIGKVTGEIMITDHLGHAITEYEIKAVNIDRTSNVDVCFFVCFVSIVYVAYVSCQCDIN